MPRPPSHLTTPLLLFALLLQPTTPTLGVIDIQNLLHPDTQSPLSSPDTPTLNLNEPPEHPSSPWTHPIKCIRSHSLSSLNQKYCLYTSSTSLINGLSLLTTPSTAALAIPHLSEEPLTYFFPPSEARNWHTVTRPWEIVHVDRKGYGVVATRRIQKYETFMIDQPSVVMDQSLEGNVDEKAVLKLLAEGVRRLKYPGVVWGLSGRHAGRKIDVEGEEEEEEGRMEEDVMMTNAFGTEFGETKFRALFPVVSRINHDCDPNSFVMFSHSGFSMGIKAYRDIEPGEEITISYLLLGKTYPQRQEQLKRWDFTCTCALCSLAAHKRQISDIRRTRIQTLTQTLDEHWREKSYHAAITDAEEMVELMKEEGLTALLADQYVVLAKLWVLYGEREKAEEYAELAVDILGDMGFLGGESKEEWGVERLLEAFGARGVYD
ncbi:SET domain-containing protein [Sporormia fimetaria CBS 119925]|uniref:SET domain-containing protein n=1 Tax=Sporormia fimetaria CBS 119925 TaxID=1340428 RepID=A0A6A6VCR9_9PLEO|nr:SET domain-containing protein [Sporormia fimetaria CBS 119925]